MRRAAREAERSRRDADRRYKAAVRSSEQASREAERARHRQAKGKEVERKQQARTRDAEKKQLEKQAAAAQVAARQAQVEERNFELQEIYTDIDTLLEATLGVDDYVDLDTLRVVVAHPPFDRGALEHPMPPPQPLASPTKPVLNVPEPPTGLRALFGKKKYSLSLKRVEADYNEALLGWQKNVSLAEEEHIKALEVHARKELQRKSSLEEERSRYAKECEVREAEAADRNLALDKLVADLGYGVVEAVEEYVSIVLSNSVYPDHFPVYSDYEFDPEHAELRLKVHIPPPHQIPSVKAYKYNKSSDEITETSLTQKACKDRYAGAVNQVALRTLHEIFEADRRGIIQTVSLEVGTETIQPATGLQAYIPFIAVGSERSAFTAFDLSSVVPQATLEHLGAAISKNPYGLVPANTSGVRKT
ncbi:MAG TPA: hypothetical protein ENH71_01490 [Pseudohongiella sp.]|nr:hypothetical protein [Pseudohongiella sp.]